MLGSYSAGSGPDSEAMTTRSPGLSARGRSRVTGAFSPPGAVARHVIRIGYVEIARVVEYAGPIRTVGEILPDTPESFWREHPWLAPEFWDPETGAYLAVVQTYVVRHGGKTILIDTGIGNDRDRPQIPVFSNLRTDFLERLGAIVDPADVDIVVNTHIHYDHVGWNTYLTADGWRPTFPNARYVVPQADFDYFRPGNAARMRAPENEDERRRFEGIRLVFTDSIAPIEAAGQLDLWVGGYEIDGVMSIVPAQGHTPGSSVVRLRDGDARALFVGDLLHSPAQILHPEWRSSFDLDPVAARVSRRGFVAEAARTDAALFPAHFKAALIGPGDEDDFAVTGWVEVPAG
jgi:glyoxylase-like metal-dependent hydrolase (beta-lactamase superfamily II)